MKSDHQKAVELLRKAAGLLKKSGGNLLIPEYGNPAEKYPLGLKPGNYSAVDTFHAVQFIADMLE